MSLSKEQRDALKTIAMEARKLAPADSAPGCLANGTICLLADLEEAEEDSQVLQRVQGSLDYYMERAEELADELATTRNQLAELQSQVAWLPIGSAPKDGTRIICRRSNRVAIGRWVGRYFSWGWADEPTHWQPIPRWQERIDHESE